MKRRCCGMLVLCLSFLTGAEAAWAKPKAGQGVIDAMGIVSALARILPGTAIQDVYADLGKPQSVKGESHQWWLLEVTSPKGERILADGSLLYDIQMRDGRVLCNRVVEVWGTQKQAQQRFRIVSEEWKKEFGPPAATDKSIPYNAWICGNDQKYRYILQSRIMVNIFWFIVCCRSI